MSQDAQQQGEEEAHHPKRPFLSPILVAASEHPPPPREDADAAAIPPSAYALEVQEHEASEQLFKASVGASPSRVTSNRGAKFMSFVERQFSSTSVASKANDGGGGGGDDADTTQTPQDGGDDVDPNTPAGLSTQSNQGSPAGAASATTSAAPANNKSFTSMRLGRGKKDNNNQFRVVSVGRKTYIQKVGGAAAAATSTSSPPQPASTGAASASPSSQPQTPVSSPPPQQQQFSKSFTSGILEVTHSVDEPINTISFMGHHDFFLPAPQPVVSRHNDDDDDDDKQSSNNAADVGTTTARRPFLRKSSTSKSDVADADADVFKDFDNENAPLIAGGSGGGGASGGGYGTGGGGGGGDDDDGGAASTSVAAAAPGVTLTEIFTGSKNVPRMFLYNLIDGACFGLWSATVLPVFMFIVAGKDNSFVGYNAAVQGTGQMVCAVIAAYVADHRILPKFYLLRFASLMGCVAIAITAYAVYAREKGWFWPSSAFWGMYIGFSNPSSESVFADSVPGGQRVAVYTYKWIVQLLSYLFGYIATVIMFEEYGDKWELNEMTPILYAGLGAHVLSMVSLWFLHDDFALDVHKPGGGGEDKDEDDGSSSGKKKKKKRKVIESSSSSNNKQQQPHECAAPERCSYCRSQKIQIRIKSLEQIKQERCGDCSAVRADCKCPSPPAARPTAASAASYTAIGSIKHHEDDDARSKPDENQQHHQQTRDDATSSNPTADADGDVEDDDDVISLADSEDRLLIEELEDDAKREKTGDPYISDIVPSCCQQDGCCCSCCCCGGGDSSASASAPRGAPLGVTSDEETDDDEADGDNNNDSNKGPARARRSLRDRPLCAKMTLVPLLIVSGDLCQAIGGGVTVRFLPLFFINDLSVTPVQLALMSIILCIFAAALSQLLKKFSSRFPRTTLIAVFRILGASLMFMLEFATGAVGSKVPMMAYFVLRSALLNSMTGLSRSVLMDFCRKRHRTIFTAMESVSTLSFSGSAAVGGVMADAHGYRSTFAVTAGFYLLAAVVVAPAGVWVDRNKQQKKVVSEENKSK